MGLFAFIALGITATVLWTLLFGDGKEAERAAARRDPQRSGPPMGEGAARMGSALKGLNKNLSFLGGQAGFELPPPPEGIPVEELDGQYTESVTDWEEPPGPAE